MQSPAMLTGGNVLLTGATGVLGAHLLKELLEGTDADIHCLVRAESQEAGVTRLLSFLRVYDPLDRTYAEFLARVKLVLGDVTEPCLGLSEVAYAELAARTDVVIHGAALTNLFARWHKVEQINHGGTKNVIEFALATPGRYMVYVSTYTVMGDKNFDPAFTFYETDLDVGQGFENMTYQRSKFLAEQAVHGATARGLRWKIVRPGQIYGESSTGFYPQGQTNVSGLFYDLFKTVIETGVALDSQSYYDVTPVDYVSRATVFLALREPSSGVTYHLTNPDEKTYSQVIHMITDLGYPIEIISQDEYRQRLFDRQLRAFGAEYKSYTTQAFKWWYRRDGFDFRRSCRTDCAATRAVLEPRGIYCPKLDHGLLETFLDRGVKLNYFPPAPVAVRTAVRS